MPRPKIDSDAVADVILDESEKLLKENSGRRLTLSDVAARVGMSQSYAHRFFATKSDLVRGLAERWFAQVEKKSHEAAMSDEPAELRLEAWLLAILREKRKAYDKDPKLFAAYLEMASDHIDIVKHHVERLRGDLRSILTSMELTCQIEDAITLVEDATVMFRTPQNIAQYRSIATDKRAKAVVQMLIGKIS